MSVDEIYGEISVSIIYTDGGHGSTPATTIAINMYLRGSAEKTHFYGNVRCMSRNLLPLY